jgi:hypothetical protein
VYARSWSRGKHGARAGLTSARAATVALILFAAAARGQELEPRAYSPSPVGVNFLVGNVTHLHGETNLDPSLPIKNVHADIDLYVVGYVRTFGLAGHSASLGLVVPYARGDVTGDVLEQSHTAHRSGIGDVRLRLAVNLLGGPALSPREFAARDPEPSLGASFSVIVPTGQYEPAHLVNIGQNRWAFKSELGFQYPLGPWFFETSAGVWLFTDNNDFFGGQRKSQDPLYIGQVHAGYNFRPGLWLAVNAAYALGGRSTVDGDRSDDYQHNSRYGATLSMPLSTGWSAKLAWSKGLTVRAGGNYEIVSLALQYRWFGL